MEILWSPWRFPYVRSSKQENRCVFCDAAQPGDDEQRLVVLRDSACFLILNRYPYSTGHLMVVPYEHVADLADLAAIAAASLIPLAQRAERALRSLYQAPGFNMGLNLGSCAGAGIAGHLHFHVVPRWPADANFMTVIAETRVIPEDLSVTYNKVKTALEST